MKHNLGKSCNSFLQAVNKIAIKYVGMNLTPLYTRFYMDFTSELTRFGGKVVDTYCTISRSQVRVFAIGQWFLQKWAGFSEVLLEPLPCTEFSGSRGRWRLNTCENLIPHTWNFLIMASMGVQTLSALICLRYFSLQWSKSSGCDKFHKQLKDRSCDCLHLF